MKIVKPCSHSFSLRLIQRKPTASALMRTKPFPEVLPTLILQAQNLEWLESGATQLSTTENSELLSLLQLAGDTVYKVTASSHNTFNISFNAESLELSSTPVASESATSSLAPGSNYRNQVVIQLGESDAVEVAAEYIDGKHHTDLPGFSRLVRLSSSGVLVDADGQPISALDIDGTSRIVVVGHGAGAGEAFTLGGKTSDQLASLLNSQLGEDVEAVKRISLVGCGCDKEGEAFPVEGYATGLFSTLESKGISPASITARTALLRVNSLGQKETGVCSSRKARLYGVTMMAPKKSWWGGSMVNFRVELSIFIPARWFLLQIRTPKKLRGLWKVVLKCCLWTLQIKLQWLTRIPKCRQETQRKTWKHFLSKRQKSQKQPKTKTSFILEVV